MGANASVAHPNPNGPQRMEAVDPNPVRLLPEQSLAIFGLLHAKRTLTWADVCLHKHINFQLCLANNIAVETLYRLQPSLQEWTRMKKCTMADCADMHLWAPNPFVDFRCSIGDLVVEKKILPPAVLQRCGLTVKELRERYGLTAELMCMLQYTHREWLDLDIDRESVELLSDAQFERIFGKVPKSDLLLRLPTPKTSSSC